ncbi:MAG: HepT-like ribonuclease domain-containing protein, partial [Desulfurivibrionaceae bacterium]
VHDYLGIDIETVWAVVEKKLPELKGAVLMALGS